MAVAVITGSAGLIGAEAARFFAARGLDIVGIDNDMRAEFFGPEASTVWSRRLLEAELTGYRDALKRGAATMSADAKAKLNQSIETKSTELKRLSEDIQAQLEEEEGAMIQQLGEKLMKVIDRYAQQNGFTIILDVSARQGPVLWAAPAIDVTSEIVKLYDQSNPAAK